MRQSLREKQANMRHTIQKLIQIKGNIFYRRDANRCSQLLAFSLSHHFQIDVVACCKTSATSKRIKFMAVDESESIQYTLTEHTTYASIARMAFLLLSFSTKHNENGNEVLPQQKLLTIYLVLAISVWLIKSI